MPVKQCGARCRTKNWAPCGGWAMKNGRCRMHGGAYKLEKHGMYTLRAKALRKKQNSLLKEIKRMSVNANTIGGNAADESP